MTILQLLLAMLYIGLTTYCLELIYSNKQEIRNIFQTLVILFWIGLSVPIFGVLLFKSLKHLHIPIDGTFVLFILVVFLTWLITKNKKK